MIFFLERKEGRERERKNTNIREKHPSVASRLCPSRGGTHSLGMHSEQESKPQIFGLRTMLEPTESPGQDYLGQF